MPASETSRDAKASEQATLERLRSQRVAGHGRVSCHAVAGATRLAGLYQQGAAAIRLPRRGDGALEAALINTAGGLTGGDRIAWEVDVGAGARHVVTTPACERIYRAAAGRAEVATTLRVAAGASLAWLPQETILFDGGALSRTIEADLAGNGRALLCEAVLFGRRAMGETVRRAVFRDRWRVRVDGRLVHAEDASFGPDADAQLPRTAALAGNAAMATVLLVGADDRIDLDRARTLAGPRGGVSRWTVGGCGKLLARLVAEDGYALRQRLVPLLELLEGGVGLPKLWSN